MKDLTSYTTFGVPAYSAYYAEPDSAEAIRDVVLSPVKYGIPEGLPLFIMGGGSNLLFTERFEGLVIRPANKGISIDSEYNGNVSVRVAAGEIWDDFVEWAVRNKLGGVENLSFIPGNVGASPVQNIGAYGVEAADVIEKVVLLDVQSGKQVIMNAENCQFGYRTSIFKQELKGRYIVTDVVFRLKREPVFMLEYSDVKEEVIKSGGITLENIRQAITNIRKRKLPSPVEFGNAGSFFKNPEIDHITGERVISENPGIPNWKTKSGYKISAAWMIEKAGWKGKRIENVGTYPGQALVIINYGGATGKNIVDFSELLIKDVAEKFGIILEPEVLRVGN